MCIAYVKGGQESWGSDARREQGVLSGADGGRCLRGCRTALHGTPLCALRRRGAQVDSRAGRTRSQTQSQCRSLSLLTLSHLLVLYIYIKPLLILNCWEFILKYSREFSSLIINFKNTVSNKKLHTDLATLRTKII